MPAKRNPNDYPSHYWLLARKVVASDTFSLTFPNEDVAKAARLKFYQFRDSLVRAPAADPQLAKGLPYVNTRIITRGGVTVIEFSRRIPVYTRAAPGARTNAG